MVVVTPGVAGKGKELVPQTQPQLCHGCRRHPERRLRSTLLKKCATHPRDDLLLLGLQVLQELLKSLHHLEESPDIGAIIEEGKALFWQGY